MGISLQFLDYRPARDLCEAYVSRVELAELFERRKRFRREPGIEHFLFLLRHGFNLQPFAPPSHRNRIRARLRGGRFRSAAFPSHVLRGQGWHS